MRFQVAAIQMDCRLGDRNYNLARGFMSIRDAARKGARLVVVPDLFATGLPSPKEFQNHAEELKGETYGRVHEIAKETGIHIVYSIIERSGKSLYNTALIVGPKGAEGYHRRTLLKSSETGSMERGFESNVYGTELGRIGLLLGHEVEFPEAARKLSGADIVCLPAAVSDLEIWDLATKARTVENGYWLIAANRSGMDRVVSFCGGSRILTPMGKVASQVMAGEGSTTSELKTADVEWARERRPYLKELRDSVSTSEK